MTHSQCGFAWQLYGGGVDILAGDSVQVSNDGVSLGASQHIIKLHHQGSISYRVNRNWKHIREKRKYFYFLWFPTRGSVQISQNSHDYALGNQEYAITSPNKPFEVTIRMGAGQVFESFLVAVPAHRMQDYIPDCELIAGRKFSITSGDTETAKQTLINLYAQAPNMSPDVICAYMRAALKGLSAPMKDAYKRTHELCSIRAVRLRLILEVIESNLANPDLTKEMLARECGISSRYVTSLLKEEGLAFNDLVWGRRLDCAIKWLQDKRYEAMTIASLAYKCGFSSAPHFSRAFKARFGSTPSEARKAENYPASMVA